MSEHGKESFAFVNVKELFYISFYFSYKHSSQQFQLVGVGDHIDVAYSRVIWFLILWELVLNSTERQSENSKYRQIISDLLLETINSLELVKICPQLSHWYMPIGN